MDQRDWEDACWDMVMECDPDESDGFKAPSLELVAKYCALYPHLANNFIDFAATCRTEEYFVKKYPPPEPTEAELKHGVQLAMKAFRRALRKAKKAQKAASLVNPKEMLAYQVCAASHAAYPLMIDPHYEEDMP